MTSRSYVPMRMLLLSLLMLLLWSSSISSFQELHRLQKPNNNKAGPTPAFPSSCTPQRTQVKVLSPPLYQSFQENDNNIAAENEIEIEDLESDDSSGPVEGQTNTRFSKYAPTDYLELDASEFRLQLRENMKADLERRRNEHPNRGNQISKNYLDSL